MSEIDEVLAGSRRWCVVEGDCLDVLPSSAIDGVLVTDPPYGIDHASSRAGPFRGRIIAGDASTETRDAVLSWWGDRPALVFGSWKRPAPRTAHTALVWNKGPAFGMGDLSVPWKPSWETIFVCGNGFRGSRDEGVLSGHTVVTWASKGRAHPNEKPVSLMMALIEKCAAEAVILDPFAGSGTTGVAALRLGRRFIGVEVNPTYAALARERCEAESQGSTLRAARAGQTALFGGT